MAGGYILYGMDASYFTQKVLGLFTYKQIPTDYRRKTLGVRKEVEAKAGTRLMPVVVTPEEEWMWDSTPIALEMERRFLDSAILPPSPALYAATRILEDFFDEWPTRQALHFRWFHDECVQVAGGSLARDSAGVPQGAELDAEGEKMVGEVLDVIKRWGRSTAEKVGAGADKHAEMEGEYLRLVELLDAHFAAHPFLLGPRPSLADFALWGGLEAHFLFDPIPKALTEAHAPNVCAFHQRLNALTASDAPNWPEEDSVPETLAPVLQHIGLGFHLFLEANKDALADGRKELMLDFGYGPNTMRTRSYAEKTRKDTSDALSALGEEGKTAIRRELGDFGVLEVYDAA